MGEEKGRRRRGERYNLDRLVGILVNRVKTGKAW
jgi:hypothetical protein